MKGSFIHHSSSDDKSIKAKVNQSSKAKNTDSSSYNNSSSSSGSWRRGGNVSLNNHNDNKNFVNNYTKYDRIDKNNNYNNNKLTNYNSNNNNNSFNNKMISKDHHHIVVDSKYVIYDLSAIIMKLKIINQELSSLFYNDSFSCSNTSNVSVIHNQREISFNEQYHDLLLTLSMLSNTNQYTLEVSCDISIEMMMMIIIMIMMTFD